MKGSIPFAGVVRFDNGRVYPIGVESASIEYVPPRDYIVHFAWPPAPEAVSGVVRLESVKDGEPWL